MRCEAEGTELIVPANLDEADSIPLLIAPILTKYEGVYVGIHDLYSERTFVTINGWKLGPNSTCYLTHEEPQTWNLAHSTCYSTGGHLAILDTREEAEYIRDLFKQIDQHKTPSDFAFLGFTDLFQRYHYRTLFGDRLPGTEISWDFKCPGNFTKLDARCGGIRRSGLLATGSCGIASMFFCEKPAKGSFKPKKILRQDPDRYYRNKHLKTIAQLENTYLDEYIIM